MVSQGQTHRAETKQLHQDVGRTRQHAEQLLQPGLRYLRSSSEEKRKEIQRANELNNYATGRRNVIFTESSFNFPHQIVDNTIKISVSHGTEKDHTNPFEKKLL